MMKKYFFLNNLLIGTLLVVMGSTGWAGIDRNLQQVYITRYLNKAFYLKLPVPGRELTIAVQAGGQYRPDFESTAYQPLFALREKVRIVDIDFGGRDITFEIAAFDGSKKAKIRFEFSTELDGPFTASDNFNAVLARVFTLGLTPADLDQAPQEYISDRYRQFIRDQARLSSLPESGVHRLVLPENPAAQALQQDVDNLQSRIRQQTTELGISRSELEKARNELREIQQNKAILQSAARDYQERIQNLDERIARLQTQNRSLEADQNNLHQTIRRTIGEIGLGEGAAGTPERMLDALSQEFRKARSANRAYQTRITQLEADLVEAGRLQTEQAARIDSLTKEIEEARRNIADLNMQLTLLTTQDQKKAAQLMELQRQKNIIESKLLSQNLLDIQTERRTTDEQQEIIIRLAFEAQDLGAVTITAPRELSAAGPNRLTLRNQCRPAGELRLDASAELRLILDYVKQFPEFQILLEPRSKGFQIKNVQSPLRDNTDLWVWEIQPEAHRAAELVFRFQSMVDGEAMPVFDVPLAVPYPTLEKTLAEFFQPLPTAMGILIGLLLALPFLLIRRRRARTEPPPPPETPRAGSMHFDNKEL
ncbi:MAG: hypothetical protein JXQ27_05805 [Acidobacteria bacterium]|nr:hypothetical protein [Acidobacteriota bacterium]